MNFADTHEAPSTALMLLEAPRALAEIASAALVMPWLSTGMRGDGHPVLVLPGLMTSDSMTAVLRHFLESQGYAVYGWGLGTNLGPREGVEETLFKRLKALRMEHERKVSLIGWSLGGIFARELAKRTPDDVRLVITLGSPFAGSPLANNATTIYEFASGEKVLPDSRGYEQLGVSPSVPTTSIFSRTDGVVAWQCSVESEGSLKENIEVLSSHCGLAANPVVFNAIADRLAQPEGEWRPFKAQGWSRHFYPDVSDPQCSV